MLARSCRPHQARPERRVESMAPAETSRAQQFDDAYRRVMAGVEVSGESINRLLPALRVAFKNGDPSAKVITLILEHLPAGSWRWREFEEQFGSRPPRDMADALHHRIWVHAYAARHEEQFTKTVVSAPYKMFSAIMDDRTAEECRILNGTVKYYNDEFWTSHPIPCSRLNCRCTWIALSRRDAERLSNVPLPITTTEDVRLPGNRQPLSPERAAFMEWLDCTIAKKRRR